MSALQSVRVNAAGTAYEAYSPSSLFQPVDATLTALAGLTIAANTLTIGTGADAFSQTSFAANTFPARASTGNLVAKTITDSGLALVGLVIAQGDLIYGTGAGTAAVLAKSTSATRYLSNTGTSNNPAWAQVALGTGVSGQLPIANGGTNATSQTTNGVAYFNGTGIVTGTGLVWDATNSRIGVGATSPAAIGHFKAQNNSDAVIFGDGTASHTGYLLQLGKNGNGAYFRVDKDGIITDIEGGSAIIRRSGNQPYFPNGLSVNYIASTTNSTAQLRFDHSPNYPFKIIPTSGGAGRALTLLSDASQSVPVFEVCNPSFTPKVWVDHNFHLNIANAGNLIFGTTTGTKIGTGSTQKLSFYGVTPISQPSDFSTFTDSTGGNTMIPALVATGDSDANDNFAKIVLMIEEVRTRLKNLGLIA